MDLVTDGQVNELAAGLLQGYLALGMQARLTKGTLATLAGVSRTRLGQLRTKGTPGLTLFLRLNQLVPRIEQGLEEGWLPAASRSAEAQEEVLARLGQA